MSSLVDPSGAPLTPATSSIITPGGTRLPHAEETALNLLLRRAGGELDGMQFYKLGWALEDNLARWDNDKGQYVYDPEKLTPICFHTNQASYHLLAWEPPSMGLLAYESELKGTDVGKGQYNCLFHFIDPETELPMAPTIQLLEVIIPVMKQMNEIAFASYRGFEATRDTLRRQSIERKKAEQERKTKEYDDYADNLLESSAPAFEGNPFSAPGPKNKSFSDLKPGERQTQPDLPAPNEFAFSVRARKR